MRRDLSFACLFLLSPCVGFAGEIDLPAMRSAVDGATLEPGRAVRLGRLDLGMGGGVLRIRSGLLIPVSGAGRSATELVFLGAARLALDTDDPVERHQLELFTGGSRLDEPIEAAVLVLPNRRYVDALLAKPPAEVLGDEGTRADQIFAAWRKSPEWRSSSAETLLLRSALGDAAVESALVLYARTARVGTVLYRVDPESFDRVTLGRFLPMELGDLDADAAEKQIRKAQREGRARDFRLADLGDWDTWYAAGKNEVTDGGAARPVHYDIAVDVRSDLAAVAGKAKIDVEDRVDGARALVFSLHPDLVVSEARDGSGAELPFSLVRGTLTVFLPEPTVSGRKWTLELHWSGPFLRKFNDWSWAPASTTRWYPSLGGTARATYDLAFRWPDGPDLVASGKTTAEGLDGKTRWSRHEVAVAVSSVSFEVGKFDESTETIAGIPVIFDFLRGDSKPDKDLRDEAVTAVRDAMTAYVERYGAYPYGELRVVAVAPRGYAQGLAGFLTLDNALLARSTEDARGRSWGGVGSGPVRQTTREIVAHELAHQWWGNKVGWHSYRDQWLSEALATYSSILVTYRQPGQHVGRLAEIAGTNRESLRTISRYGAPVVALGPVVLGGRLDSSLSSSAYTRIVYDKGSIVFAALGLTLGEDRLQGALRAVADRVAGGTIDTERFFDEISKATGVPLQPFVDRYVLGTDAPDVVYTYEVDPDGERWRVHGSAKVFSSSYGNWHALVREDGASLRREAHPAFDPAKGVLPAPFAAAVVGAKEQAIPEKDPTALNALKSVSSKGLGGIFALVGAAPAFEVRLPKEPERFWLDPRNLTLSEFHNATHQPKASARVTGECLRRLGRYDEADAALRDALSALFRGPRAPDDRLNDRERKVEEIRENGRIRVDLALVALDLGRLDEARAELDAADDLLRGPDRGVLRTEREIARARLDAEGGKWAEVYDALRERVYLEFRQSTSETVADRARRASFADNDLERADAYALLAVSAARTGHPEVAAAARHEAERRGVVFEGVSLGAD